MCNGEKFYWKNESRESGKALVWEILSDKVRLKRRPGSNEEASIVFVTESVFGILNCSSVRLNFKLIRW